MHSYNNVNRFLQQKNASEEALIIRLEQQEAKQKGETPTPSGDEERKGEVAPVKEKKWKQRIIKIWQYNEMLE